MKVYDRVQMSPMWKYETAMGTIIKMPQGGYIVVKWDDINGEWHYTQKQSERLEVIDGHA